MENVINLKNIFNLEEADKIIKVGDNLKISDATVLKDTEFHKDADERTLRDHSFRKTKVSWIAPPIDAAWMIPHIYKIWNKHGMYEQFEILQYAIYNKGGHFDWHIDHVKRPPGSKVERKSAAIVQLSDSSEYEGGNLEINYNGKISSIEKKKGLVTILPIDMPHRVTEVTKGIRKSLVIWALGLI